MPRPLLPSELGYHTLPDDGTSISARVREDLAANKVTVSLAHAASLARRVVSRQPSDDEGTRGEVLAHEAHYLARAVLRQNALLDEYEARLAERERT